MLLVQDWWLIASKQLRLFGKCEKAEVGERCLGWKALINKIEKGYEQTK